MAHNTPSLGSQKDQGSSSAARPTKVPISMLLSNEEQTAIGILPASYWQQQSTEEEPDDTCVPRARTASLTESIFQYRHIHGRTYHSELGNADSWEPNDERHIDAMEIAHHTYMVTIGHKLYRAPLDKKNIQKVLDIGTGTGLWAIDFADEFPEADVLGTDITPIQHSWVPANVKFELDDCNQEWTWPDNTFDFINARMLVGVIEDWYELHRQAFRTCKPGGYIETFVACTTFQCDDGTVKEDSAMSQWSKVFNEGGRRFGRTFEVYDHDLQRKAMAAAGFVDIEYKDYLIPIGGWGDDKEAAESGLWWKIALEADLEGYLNYIFNELVGWTPEETKSYADQIKKEWSNPNIHGYVMSRSAWGRKPENKRQPSDVFLTTNEIPIAGFVKTDRPQNSFTSNSFKYPNLSFIGDPAAGQISRRSIPTGGQKFIINFDETRIPFEFLDGATYDIRGNNTTNGKTDAAGYPDSVNLYRWGVAVEI